MVQLGVTSLELAELARPVDRLLHETLTRWFAFLESMQNIEQPLLVLLVAVILGFIVHIIEEHYGEVAAGPALAGFEKE